MRKEYEDELTTLRERMEAAEIFAEKLPLFADQILCKKYTETDDCVNFGTRYKQIPLDRGIHRCFFKERSDRVITNYDGNYDDGIYLFRIYIDSISLYQSHDQFGLGDLQKSVPIFFFDSFNSVFYFTDEQSPQFLEKINEWYIRAKGEAAKMRLRNKIEDAKKQQEEAEEELNRLEEKEI